MNERAQEPSTESNQTFTPEISCEEELLESLEERVDELTDDKYHYSINILEAKENSVKLEVYGVEGYDLPAQRTVANAVGEKYGWTPGFQEEKSTEDRYRMRVIDWKNTSGPL